MTKFNAKVWACGHITATEDVEGPATLSFDVTDVDIADCQTCRKGENTKDLIQADTPCNVPDFIVYDEEDRPIKGKISGVIE